MSDYIVEEIDNTPYAIFEFKYIENEKHFILLEDINKNKINLSKVKIAKVYIRIPSWIDIQDLRCMSSYLDIKPKVNKYVVDEDVLKISKIKVLCWKIIDAKNRVYIPKVQEIKELDYDLFYYILNKIDIIISEYYLGNGLDDETYDIISDDCFRYYKAVYKQALLDENTILPPQPGAVALKNLCEHFKCTPNEIRKINRRDLDMILIAKTQDNICQNTSLIGGGKNRYKKK